MTTIEKTSIDQSIELESLGAYVSDKILFDEISANGLMLRITPDELGISRVENIENRLGKYQKQVDVTIESDPDNQTGFMARFSLREDL